MNELDQLAQDIYLRMIIRDDIQFANPGARLLAVKRAEGAYTLAEIFLEVKHSLQKSGKATGLPESS
jgi:hypothetical protein